VSAATQSAWDALIRRRAVFVADVLIDRLLSLCS
jgi:hypothetical protein